MNTLLKCAIAYLLVGSLTAHAEAPNPQELVAAMQKLYAGCRSYRDRGTVEVAYLNEDGSTRGGDRRPFSTSFVRPDKFRFEFKDESGGYGDLYVIWADGTSVRSWWTNRPKVESWRSIGDAIDAATGVSGGSAHLMANLLLSDVGGVGPRSLSEIRLTGEEIIDGTSCWRLEGRGWLAFMSKSPMVFWVEKKTPRLRKVSYMFDIPGSKSRTTITLVPMVDVDVDAGVFSFTPPNQ